MSKKPKSRDQASAPRTVTRRDALCAMASFLVLGRRALSAQESASARIHLNHVNVRVSDLQRSLDFYQGFFGFTTKRTNTYQALQCANRAWISLQTKADIDQESFRLSPGSIRWAETVNEGPGELEHFCFEIASFDINAAQQALAAAGFEAFVTGIVVGAMVDLSSKFGHEPHPLEADRIQLNHVNLRVDDWQRSAEFYRRFFGFTVGESRTYHALVCANGSWASLQTKADIDQEQRSFGSAPGAVKWSQRPQWGPGLLEHFCFQIQDFDINEAQQKLNAAGVEAFVTGSHLWTVDPDGVLLQILHPDFRFSHEGA